jgi:uncharacterized protein YfaA (DUF2138 family)
MASRWLVGLGALAIAAAALFVLLRLGGEPRQARAPAAERARPAMDDIDEPSRARMRELLDQDGDGS